MTVRASVQGATLNMLGQVYRGRANATALSSGQCWAPSRTIQVLVLAWARRCALAKCGEKKCELRF